MKASDAGNCAVIANTDEMSAAVAREAQQANEAAQKEADLLAVLLRDLGLAREASLLNEFRTKFSDYRALDSSILEAQPLSLNQKRKIAAACEASLRALHDALAKQGFAGTR
jgi:hypothetical protein